eukprot:c9962_g1_i2.p1 GENE.c9962_g1_i2~~c9962_g1_i2.p1  ORF type:complete len:479 (-),score=110.36 c9962_g1_i2:67-1473(-)
MSDQKCGLSSPKKLFVTTRSFMNASPLPEKTRRKLRKSPLESIDSWSFGKSYHTTEHNDDKVFPEIIIEPPLDAECSDEPKVPEVPPPPRIPNLKLEKYSRRFSEGDIGKPEVIKAFVENLKVKAQNEANSTSVSVESGDISRKQEPHQILNASIDDFEFLGILGTGSFGKVFLAQYLPTNTMYAIKSLEKYLLIQHNMVETAFRENQVLKQIRSPFIVRHFGCFQSVTKLFIIQERVIGLNLFDLYLQHPVFEESTVRFFAAQLVIALEHLHEKGIAYRNLKPEHIYIDRSGYIKLIDLHYALKLQHGQTYTFCGSPCFMAPEQINPRGHGIGVDYWALGVVLYEMISGHLPFDSENIADLYDRILKTECEFDNTFSCYSESLIRSLLRKNPSDRLGCGKNGISEIKEHPFFADIDWHQVAARKVPSPLQVTHQLQHYVRPCMDEDVFDGEVVCEKDQQVFRKFGVL